MNFIRKTLSSHEEINKIFKLNRLIYISPFFLMLLSILVVLLGLSMYSNSEKEVFLIVSIAGIFLFLTSLFSILSLNSIDMGVTNQRIVYKKGIFSIHNEEIQIKAVETVEVSQTITGRLLGYGDVKVTGRGDSVVVFEGIDDPIEVKKAIGSSIL